MQAESRILDDIARVAGGAVGLMAGLRRQIREEIRSRIDEAALRLDLVPREEFERLEAVTAKARAEIDRLEKRIAALETAERSGKAVPKAKKTPRAGSGRADNRAKGRKGKI